MNPRITGVGMNAAIHPIRSAPKSKKKAPIRIASVEVSALMSHGALRVAAGARLSPSAGVTATRPGPLHLG